MDFPQQFGKYTLLRRLATGGMAEIFLAIQKSVAGFEKLIVIKRILPAMNQDKAFIEMLLHEARVAATMSHPNIVPLYEAGVFRTSPYLVFAYVEGETLRELRDREGPMPVTRARPPTRQNETSAPSRAAPTTSR